ncbi:MAG: RHS repeat-associated core domain-containing protein [Candidatus Omnitrophica bacterium]|nr:RHS repeat-associated core domain-containing protein [Candidatus Omnitrophota bacterium]
MTDPLGSVIALVDESQTVQATFTYYAFGSLLEKTGSADTSFRFTGRDWDLESGLYHLRARGYDARVGRFLQQDPWPRTPGDPRMIGLRYLAGLAQARHPVPGTSHLLLPASLPLVNVHMQRAFLQRPLGLNSYPLVYNNPLNAVDPLGTNGIVVVGGGSAEAGVGPGYSAGAYQSGGIGFIGRNVRTAGLFGSSGSFLSNALSGSAGAFGGVSVGLGYTTANSVSDLGGAGTTYTLNASAGVYGLTIQVTVGNNGVTTVTVSPVGMGFGVSYSEVRIETSTVSLFERKK